MKILLVALLYSSVVFASGNSADDKKTLTNKRWHTLMALVGQEMKILESAKRKGVDIRYRMLELHSERLKLIHEKNNLEFMAKSVKVGSGKNKESFFKETRNYYNFTKKFGLDLLKKNPSKYRRAEVLYA